MRPSAEMSIRERVASIPIEAAGGGADLRGSSPGEFRNMIEAAYVVADEARSSLQRWVDAGRREGMSWAEIGEVLGITKQAAQQRFRSDLEVGVQLEPDQIEVRVGATAFNEERILDQEGRKGAELMRVGLLTLVFRKTSSIWEYRRVVAVTSQLAEAKLAPEGWSYTASWFPFHYFKRLAPL